MATNGCGASGKEGAPSANHRADDRGLLLTGGGASTAVTVSPPPLVWVSVSVPPVAIAVRLAMSRPATLQDLSPYRKPADAE